MTQFHEGQEVEVKWRDGIRYGWKKAKIVWQATSCAPGNPKCYEVEFPDGASATFDADHLRARLPLTEGDYDPDGINQAVRKQLASGSSPCHSARAERS